MILRSIDNLAKSVRLVAIPTKQDVRIDVGVLTTADKTDLTDITVGENHAALNYSSESKCSIM